MQTSAAVISQIQQQGLTESCSQSPNSSDKTRISPEAKDIQAISFGRLMSNYGPLWSVKFGGDGGEKLLKIAQHEWALQLGDYDMRQVMDALTSWMRANKYPPAVSDIVDRIEAKIRRGAYKLYKGLPKPQASPEVAKAAIAEIRKRHGRPRGVGAVDA